MSTDQDLIEVLNEMLEPAKKAFEFQFSGLYSRPYGVADIWDLAKPLEAALNAHPEFAEPKSLFFLGKQIGFFNHHQAINLLRSAVESDAVSALAWYRRVMATKSAKMRVVAEVFGLFVHERHTFSNGVVILPLAELSDSPNSQALKNSASNGLAMEFPAAVMFDVGEIEDGDHSAGHARFLEIADVMRRTVTALVLSDNAAPTMTVAWQEFADPELERATFGRVWMTSRHDGRHAQHPANVTDDMYEWVERYLALSAEAARACDVPLARLNLARRRISVGDRAIDGSVCLEALLSGRGRGELTHKLSIRTALLLGRGLVERQEIASKVRKFYQLRSDFVHGGTAKKEADNREVVDQGLTLCLEALRAVIIAGVLPEPEIWELTGGPPSNPYSDDERAGLVEH